MRPLSIIPLLVFITASFSGCAKGPAGGPVVPAANRLTVNMTLQQAINPQFHYAFAFDDDNDSTDGPRAIFGPTSLANGVVTESFTVLVRYRGGQFQVFRRTDIGNNQERLDRSTNAFVDTPTVSGNAIRFTLNLDATLDSDTTQRLFSDNLQKLDINFVTTSEIIGPTDNFLHKPFDEFSVFGFGNYYTFDVSSTRTYRNRDTVQEPTNDVTDVLNRLPSAQQRSQLDITDFTIEVRRSNSS